MRKTVVIEGKTNTGLKMLVNHCFENRNALALIITREPEAWDKLIGVILPKSKIRSKRMEHTKPLLDCETKMPYIWIKNRFRGFSRVVKYPAAVKGKEPSFIFVQPKPSKSEMDCMLQQIGRRPLIDKQAIYCAMK